MTGPSGVIPDQSKSGRTTRYNCRFVSSCRSCLCHGSGDIRRRCARDGMESPCGKKPKQNGSVFLPIEVSE